MKIIFLFAVSLLAVVAVPAVAQNDIRIITEENAVSVQAGKDLLLRYCYKNVPFKPYVQQLFSPGGINVLRDAPADHLHHHALMFAVAVDGVNFWEEQQAPGRQEHRTFAGMVVDRCVGGTFGSFAEQINWVGPHGKGLLLQEIRAIEVCQLAEPAVTLLTWASSFEVPAGKESVTLTGSPYFGLGMRFLQSMDTGGKFFNSDGKTGVQETNDKQAMWCAYSASADGKPVTIAMFDFPGNQRHPATWFTMDNPFAYLSATLNLHKEPLKIVSGKPLWVRYGVALWDGQVQPEQIDKLYKQWAGWRRQLEKVEN
jgi:hypothetical protein